MAGRDALQSVRDEAPRAASRFDLSLLLDLAHHARHLVADLLLRLIEKLPLRVLGRKSRDPLERPELVLFRRFQLFLELLHVRLAVQERLVAALQLEELAVDRLLLRRKTLL